MTQVPLYDALAVDYDRFVNWEGRLHHERPFFLSLFEQHGVRRVLDAACGTGHHAIALAQEGFQVLGADLSTPMIERASENAAALGVGVEFTVAGFGGYGSLGHTYDAAICLGNSLPHLLSEAALEEALADFAAVLRPGGILVIQNRNFDRIWREQARFMSPETFQDSEGEWIFVRFYDFYSESLTFNILRLRRTAEGWAQDIESTELRPVFGQDLALALAAAGFGAVTLLGSYDGSPFDPAESGDLVAIASKAG